MTELIDNYADCIDSRDVIARVEELEADRETLQEAVNDAQEALDTFDLETYEGGLPADLHPINLNGAVTDAKAELDGWEDADEYNSLKILVEDGEGLPDWNDGVTLIRDSYFEDYAREFAEEIGAIPDDAKWPCDCIDWEQAASELQMDYTSVDFNGVTYWAR